MKTAMILVAATFLMGCQDQEQSSVNGLPGDQIRFEGEPAILPTTANVEGGPSNGSCSDAQASLVYTISRYEGGAAPFPGMITGLEKLSYQGNVVGQTTTRQLGGDISNDDDNKTWELTLRFVEDTKQVLESTGNNQAGSETYAQQVEATKVRGLGPSMQDNRFFAYVICKNTWNFLLP